MAVVLAGGGFKRGYVHGTTDANGMAPATDPCTPDDIGATMFHCLGIDPKKELQTPTGRPIQLFREGKVIEKAACLRQPLAAVRCTQSHKPQAAYSLTNSLNISRNRFVIGPGLPLPITRPSHFTTAMISAAVPVRKHSSAV